MEEMMIQNWNGILKVPAFTLLLITYSISYFDNEWRFCWMENRRRNKMQNGSWLIQWINSSVLMRKWLWNYKRKKQDEVC